MFLTSDLKPASEARQAKGAKRAKGGIVDYKQAAVSKYTQKKNTGKTGREGLSIGFRASDPAAQKAH